MTLDQLTLLVGHIDRTACIFSGVYSITLISFLFFWVIFHHPVRFNLLLCRRAFLERPWCPLALLVAFPPPREDPLLQEISTALFTVWFRIFCLGQGVFHNPLCRIVNRRTSCLAQCACRIRQDICYCHRYFFWLL